MNGQIRLKLLPESRLGEAVVEIDRAALHDLLEEYDAPVPAVCNADLMVIAGSIADLRHGAFQVLVGECHAVRELLSHGPMGPFIQDAFPDFLPLVGERYSSLVGPGEIVVDVIRSHSDKTLAQAQLPGFDLEVQGRSPKERQDVIALHDLVVRHTTDGLRLYAARLDRYVRLMGPPLGTFQLKRNPFTVFGFPRYYTGPPIKTPGLLHVPRLVAGRVVLQREQWSIPAEELSRPVAIGRARFDDIDGGEFLRARRLHRSLGLPRHVFVKLPGEAKPIYVDFDAPLVVRQLSRLARRTPGTLVVTEMLPGPAQLWFSASDGPATCELRLALFNVRPSVR
jgi:hypothetical protein